mmetsp:Transcript_44990/g.91837  ORF Transcript_44990/g.91837 Transcript_44990/m.91837 type:complete len:206 (-) Transcript_44990:1479-2096(-)
MFASLSSISSASHKSCKLRISCVCSTLCLPFFSNRSALSLCASSAACLRTFCRSNICLRNFTLLTSLINLSCSSRGFLLNHSETSFNFQQSMPSVLNRFSLWQSFLRQSKKPNHLSAATLSAARCPSVNPLYNSLKSLSCRKKRGAADSSQQTATTPLFEFRPRRSFDFAPFAPPSTSSNSLTVLLLLGCSPACPCPVIRRRDLP